MGVAFEVGFLPNRPVNEVAESAVFAEQLGFAGVWVADSQSIFRDGYTALTLCAARTGKVRLATGVTNPITRHPAVIAGSIATLDELSGGRAILGLGVGESAVRTLGLKPARLAELEESTGVIRSLRQGKPTSYRGTEIKMTWPQRAVPIYYSSSGPRSLQLAGRVADGVLFQVGSDPALVSYAIKNIRLGAEQAGRKLSEIGLYVRLACSVSGNRKRAREEIKGYAAAAAGTVFASVPKSDVPDGLWTDLERMKKQYDYYQHASSAAEHKELVTDNILDSIAIAGTPEEAIPRFKEIIALGVDGFVIPVTTSDPKESMRTLAERVIPFAS
jgi:5,10-methylenetetrahydromethanopterin reductase